MRDNTKIRLVLAVLAMLLIAAVGCTPQATQTPEPIEPPVVVDEATDEVTEEAPAEETEAAEVTEEATEEALEMTEVTEEATEAVAEETEAVAEETEAVAEVTEETTEMAMEVTEEETPSSAAEVAADITQTAATETAEETVEADLSVVATAGPTEIAELGETEGDAVADEEGSAEEDSVLEVEEYVAEATGVAEPSETFTSEATGFTFDYPEGWFITGTGEEDDPVILSSFEPEENGTEGIDPEETKIDFVPVEVEGELDDWLTEQQDDITSTEGEVDQVYSVELPGGAEGRLIHFTDAEGEERKVLLTRIDDQDFIIAGYGDLERFEEIVLTLRSIDDDDAAADEDAEEAEATATDTGS